MAAGAQAWAAFLTLSLPSRGAWDVTQTCWKGPTTGGSPPGGAAPSQRLFPFCLWFPCSRAQHRPLPGMSGPPQVMGTLLIPADSHHVCVILLLPEGPLRLCWEQTRRGLWGQGRKLGKHSSHSLTQPPRRVTAQSKRVLGGTEEWLWSQVMAELDLGQRPPVGSVRSSDTWLVDGS